MLREIVRKFSADGGKAAEVVSEQVASDAMQLD